MESPTMNELAGALAKAQASMKNPVKNKLVQVRSQKGNYDFRYADLSACLDAVRGPLSENGIALTQPLVQGAQGLLVRTMLIHSSGQSIHCDYPLSVPDGSGPQAVGSAITYGRRYGLVCLTGIVADDDDDGNAAEGNEAKVSDSKPSAKEEVRRKIESSLTDLKDSYEERGMTDLFALAWKEAGGPDIWPKAADHIPLPLVERANFVLTKLRERAKLDLAKGAGE